MKNTVPFILILLCLGCSNKKEEAIDWSKKTIALKGNILHVDSALYNGLYSVQMFNDTLIGKLSSKSPYKFSICQIRNDSIISLGSFLTIGNGPYEMAIPFANWNHQEQLLTIYDYYNQQNKIFHIPLNDIQNLFDVKKWIVSQFTPFVIGKQTIYPDAICAIDTAHFITNSPYCALKMFASIDNNADSCKLLDYNYPDDQCIPDNSIARALAYKGRFKKHPTRNRFIYFAQRNRYMLILDYQNGQMTEIATPYKQYPQYKLDEKQRDISTNKECLLGANIGVTSKYIYVAMNEYTYDDLRKSREIPVPWDSYNDLYVFDWDGNPVTKYTLENPMNFFWIDNNDNYLYTTTDALTSKEDATTFIRYRLK